MKLRRHKRKFDQEQGFTLIELMVSLSLFVIVVLAAVASLYTVNNASKKVQAMRTALDNLNFAIESMSRSIRTGTNIICTGCSLASGSAGGDITFQNTLGTPGSVQYIRDDATGSIIKRSNGQFVKLTSPEINVQNLQFFAQGTDPADGIQPSVMILLQGNANAGGTIAPFAVQTMVTQRTFE